MSDPQYDPNTTYIIYPSSSLGPSFEDIFYNIYTLDASFPNYTYTNSDPSLVPTFYTKSSTIFYNPIIKNMTEVVLGDNIEAGICHFAECGQLESVTINYHNDRISAGAFGECQSLNSVRIPKKTIKSVEAGAFYGCTKLTNFEFDNITYIGTRAFQDCFGFTTLQFNNNSYFFVSNAFLNDLSLNAINFTKSNCVGVIQPGAFVDTGITSVTLPPNMLYTATPINSQYNGGSFPPGCDVSGGRIGFGVVGNFKLTSIGTDSTGRVFTATATTTGTATGINYSDALSKLLFNATTDFMDPAVSSFEANYGSSGSTTHTLDFTLVG